MHDWGCVFGYQLVMRHPSLVSKIVGVDIGDAGTSQHVQSLNAKAKAMVFVYQIWLAIACSRMNYPYYIKWTGTHGSYRDVVTFEPPVPMLFVYGKRKPFFFHTQAWADA